MEKHFGKKEIIIIITIVFSILIVAGLVFLCCIRFSDKVYSNVFLGEENISNYTPDKLVRYVGDLASKIKSSSIELYEGESKVYTVNSEALGIDIDINATVKNALGFGRKKAFFENLKDIFSAWKTPVYIDISYNYEKEKMDTLIKNINLSLDERVIYDTYSLDYNTSTLTLIKGKNGYIVNEEEFKERIINDLITNNSNKFILSLDKVNCNILDADKIYSEIKKEPQDAYIDKTSSKEIFVAEVKGVDIDKEQLIQSIDKLSNLKENESVKLNLIIVEPKVYLKDIRYDTFNEKLGSYTTYFAGNQVNRSKNIEISSNFLNDVVIMPGEIFSFNNTIGEVTEDKGYLNASTFQGR